MDCLPKFTYKFKRYACEINDDAEIRIFQPDKRKEFTETKTNFFKNERVRKYEIGILPGGRFVYKIGMFFEQNLHVYCLKKNWRRTEPNQVLSPG